MWYSAPITVYIDCPLCKCFWSSQVANLAHHICSQMWVSLFTSDFGQATQGAEQQGTVTCFQDSSHRLLRSQYPVSKAWGKLFTKETKVKHSEAITYLCKCSLPPTTWIWRYQLTESSCHDSDENSCIYIYSIYSTVIKPRSQEMTIWTKDR